MRIHCRCLVIILYLFAELANVIRNSFTPEPEVVVLESVTDTKQWMDEQTPPMHDHLKAHQFKFQANEYGQCRMFYKEWSTDDFWLPQSGLAILPTDHPTPIIKPLILRPCYDSDSLKKLEATLRKASAYLNKAGVSAWWTSWLEEAMTYVEPQQPQEMEGTL